MSRTFLLMPLRTTTGTRLSRRKGMICMHVNVLLFSDFETLDAFGPVEVLGRVAEFQLHFISAGGGIVTSSQGVPVITESWDRADFSGIILVPGGQGTRTLVNDRIFTEKLHDIVLQSEYCLTVCTGSALLAKTQLLNGRKATSNKRAFAWVQLVNPAVQWVSQARWVVDGRFYTSSGVSAGIDMALGFVADLFGNGRAAELARRIEYVWNANAADDPFAR